MLGSEQSFPESFKFACGKIQDENYSLCINEVNSMPYSQNCMSKRFNNLVSRNTILIVPYLTHIAAMFERNVMKHLGKACSSKMRSILSNKIKLVSQIYLRAPILLSRVENENTPEGEVDEVAQLSTKGSKEAQTTEIENPMVRKVYQIIDIRKRTPEECAAHERQRIAAMDIGSRFMYGRKQGWYEGKKGLANLRVHKTNISIPFSRSFHGSAMQGAKFYDPTYDAVFKRLFGSEQNEDLTISFINSILEFGGERRVSKILQLRVDDTNLQRENDKSTILDIFCEDQNGDRFIIEMQRVKEKGYIERAQYYLAGRFGTQLGRSQNYTELKPYYMISVLNHELFPSDKAVRVISTNDKDDLDDTSHNMLKWIYIELPKVKHWKGLKGHEDAKAWLDFLSKASELHEMPEGVMPEIKRAYELVEEESVIEEERKEIMQQEESERRFTEFVERQMYYSKKEGKKEGIEEGREEGKKEGREEGKKEGREEGKKEGREEGKKEGREEGRDEGIQVVARRMLAQGVSVDTIQSFTELSKEQIQSVKDDMDSER